MAIRKYKPTTPGRRGSRVADFVEVTRIDAGEVADPPAAQEGRPQQQGPDHDPAPGRRAQARVPADRLPPLRQGRRARQGRADRVRPQPHGPDRAAALRRRREALHHRAAGPAPGHRARDRPGGRHQARQQPAAAQHPGRHDDPRDRAAARRRRQDRPLGRRLGAAGRQGGPRRPAADAVRRDALRRRALPRHRRRGRQRRAVQHQLGQGRPDALEGQAPDRARCGHEPRRPPARRWRGQDLRWPPPGLAVGQARGPHPQAARPATR